MGQPICARSLNKPQSQVKETPGNAFPGGLFFLPRHPRALVRRGGGSLPLYNTSPPSSPSLPSQGSSKCTGRIIDDQIKQTIFDFEQHVQKRTQQITNVPIISVQKTNTTAFPLPWPKIKKLNKIKKNISALPLPGVMNV